ncbi:Oidioi.mRNA.OKI2018_I69.XSR.g14608.t1.cds [Oikopleura dioica]|uniref:Oidioi.mRNA.OKI2018_I69.XSR.g14608.t1.cds n=1 Tax=Oikopleura dioica TaxID=34765 RepID=A0ABN7SGM0_OIKDI|nr:Oidioi.mRNA.OKI2018_I69.XSR.g14608.t1.cds [Oikopleura dioica]
MNGRYAGGEKGSLVNLIMRMANVNFLHKYAFDNSKTRESVVIEIQSSRNVSRTEVVVRAHFQVSVSLRTFAVRKGQKTVDPEPQDLRKSRNIKERKGPEKVVRGSQIS